MIVTMVYFVIVIRVGVFCRFIGWFRGLGFCESDFVLVESVVNFVCFNCDNINTMLS